jgi:hypothetical protein
MKWLHQILQIENLYNNAKENLDDFIFIHFFKKILQKVYSKWMFFTNWHLLVMDGHGSHVTL